MMIMMMMVDRGGIKINQSIKTVLRTIHRSPANTHLTEIIGHLYRLWTNQAHGDIASHSGVRSSKNWLHLSFALLSKMFITLYPAFLVAMFSVTLPPRAPFDDLVGMASSGYQLMIQNQTAIQEMFQTMAAEESARGRATRSVWQPWNVNENGSVDWTVLQRSKAAAYSSVGRMPSCGFTAVPMHDEILYQQVRNALFAFPKTSGELADAFDWMSMRMAQNGVSEALRKRFRVSTPVCKRKVLLHAETLTLRQVESPFALLAVMLAVAVVVMIGEGISWYCV